MNQYIIFDYDGTLHNTMCIYGTAFRKTYEWLVKEGNAPRRQFEDGEISRWLGINSRDMWNSFMPSLSAEKKEAASRNVGDLMLKQIQNGEAKLYEGGTQMLQSLKDKGYHLIFLSNCKIAYMEANRERFELDHYFDAFYCCEAYNFIPKKDIFPIIGQDHPGSYMVVGDRFSDMEVAVVHHLLSIGCAYGFGKPEELKTADAIVCDVRDIAQTVAKLWEL